MLSPVGRSFRRFLALLGVITPVALAVATGSVGASETRMGRDPRVSLDTLKREQKVRVTVSRAGGVYQIDASALLLGADPSKLRTASSDFDRYVDMGMPNLKASRIVERQGNRLWTWSHLSTSGQTSKHYYEVELLPEGSTWFQVPRRAGWTLPDDSAFRRNEGSWFMEPLADGSIYVRYFLLLEIDSSIPDFIIDLVAGQKLATGVKDVVRVLARVAGASPLQ
jgi:hypothetical protein